MVDMLNGILTLFLFLNVSSPFNPEQEPGAKSADGASIESVVAAVYDVISGPAGQKRDWDRMRSLFAPGARLIPVTRLPDGNFESRVLSVDDYIARASSAMQAQGFFEREIAREVEQFGQIAHVFSTYESRHAAGDPKPFARGINSFQVINDGKRWWVLNILWEAERPDNPIPLKYLK